MSVYRSHTRFGAETHRQQDVVLDPRDPDGQGQVTGSLATCPYYVVFSLLSTYHERSVLAKCSTIAVLGIWCCLSAGPSILVRLTTNSEKKRQRHAENRSHGVGVRMQRVADVQLTS